MKKLCVNMKIRRKISRKFRTLIFYIFSSLRLQWQLENITNKLMPMVEDLTYTATQIVALVASQLSDVSIIFFQTLVVS